MDFIDFYYKVKEMGHELEEKGIKPTDVKIGYTKATGEHIIVAMKGSMVVSYFKW